MAEQKEQPKGQMAVANKALETAKEAGWKIPEPKSYLS